MNRFSFSTFVMNRPAEQPDWTPPRTGLARTNHDSCIVGCGIGLHYRKALRSTVNHCEVYCPEAWKLWYDDYPIGCPTHRDNPYAFKIFALQRVIDAGFRYVLWMDTSFQPIGSIEPLWKHIEEHGWFAAKQGDSMLGEWISDHALGLCSGARDELMNVPLVYTGIVGLDLGNAVTRRLIWEPWKEAMQLGVFRGAHFNAPIGEQWEAGHKWHGWCSEDSRCKGHRHDEAALSYILHAGGYKVEASPFLTLENEKGFIGHMVPDYDVVKLREATLNLASWVDGDFGYKNQESVRDLCL